MGDISGIFYFQILSLSVMTWIFKENGAGLKLGAGRMLYKQDEQHDGVGNGVMIPATF